MTLVNGLDCNKGVVVFFSVADPDIPFRGGAHEMSLNVKGTVGTFGGR